MRAIGDSRNRGRANRPVWNESRKPETYSPHTRTAPGFWRERLFTSLLCASTMAPKRFAHLDDQSVSVINTNLMTGVDLTKAQRLGENIGISFEGSSPKGPFEITPQLAAKMLVEPLNPHGLPNSKVVRPVMNGSRHYHNGLDGMYSIDFGQMEMDEACLYRNAFRICCGKCKTRAD